MSLAWFHTMVLLHPTRIWIKQETSNPEKMNIYDWKHFFEQQKETESGLSENGVCDIDAIKNLIPDSNEDDRLDNSEIKAVMTDEKVKY